MLEGLFQPSHLLVMLLISVLSWGTPFLAGYFLDRYVEMKKLKGLTDALACAQMEVGSSIEACCSTSQL